MLIKKFFLFFATSLIHCDDICSQRKRPKTNLEGEHWKQTLGNYILIQIEELKLKDYRFPITQIYV